MTTIEKLRNRDAAEHGIAADRFARDRSVFEVVLCSALAAAERQTVGPLLIMRISPSTRAIALEMMYISY